MITSHFPHYVAVFSLLFLSVGALDTFIAAMYKHAVIIPNETKIPVSKEEALLQMNKNINAFEEAVKQAATQGVPYYCDPEDEIYGWIFTRDTIYLYLEDIPDPEVNCTLCKDPQRFGYAPVQERLSFLARDNAIYVVANMGDKKPCNASDPQCPPDGRYQYNTNVVFDSEGRLVARYHKYNLFALETRFDFPKDPDFVTLNTPFGKFGIFTCFDILFYKPAVMLVDKFQVDSVLFSTAWYNLLPFISAVPFHSAWARTMRVNLLAANGHNTSMHRTGSGIYTPEGIKTYHYDMETESGQLMLSELKARPRSEPTYPAPVDWSAYAKSIKPFSSEQSEFSEIITFDEFTFIELKRNAGSYTVCQKDLCCHLTYKMCEKRTDEVYALGAFNGLHTVVRQYYLQTCTLVKCRTTDLRTCGKPIGSASTKFEEFSLSGTFGTSYVFPQLILSGSQLAPESYYEVSRDGRLKSRSGAPLLILAINLYGRMYERDPPHGRMYERDPPHLRQGPGKHSDPFIRTLSDLASQGE
ncbi:vascular non-inflammatory molecule 3-like [Saccopteryx bilineata]|uniref:vascular non-inflammatory molecule 3-like n=1 Tax=Saccopteryx bilineata TaxID=59482 RepID=UPI00338D3C4E